MVGVGQMADVEVLYTLVDSLVETLQPIVTDYLKFHKLNAATFASTVWAMPLI